MHRASPLRAVDAFSQAFGLDPVCANNARTWGGLSACDWKLPWREGFELAKNDDLIVAYHSAGSRRVRAACDGRWIERNSTPGLISVIPPGRHVKYKIEGAVSFSSIHIPRESVAGISGSRFVGPQSFLFAFRNVFANACMDTLLSEMRSGGSRNLLYINAVTRALLLNLMRGFPAEPPVNQTRVVESGIPLTPIIDFIEMRLATSLTLNELAHQAGVSRAHFARHFRTVTGMSPHQYVLLRRTEKAKELLRNTRHGLLRIAQETGFSSQSHFSQVFHSITGGTPSKFRQSAQVTPART